MDHTNRDSIHERYNNTNEKFGEKARGATKHMDEEGKDEYHLTGKYMSHTPVVTTPNKNMVIEKDVSIRFYIRDRTEYRQVVSTTTGSPGPPEWNEFPSLRSEGTSSS